jgi:methylated-DNA-protein-cysteine methyltransferase-like protein
VPWHRVVNAAGRVSLGEERGAAPLQRALLEAEGIVFDARGRIALEVVRWEP